MTSEIGEKKKGEDKVKPKSGKALLVLRELFSICFWIYMFFQFFFNADLYLAQKIPNLQFVINCKIFFILGLPILFWMILGNEKFISSFLYIVFYPFIFFLWKLPRAFFKSWNGLFIFLMAVFEVFKSFKTTLMAFFFGALSCFLIYQNINLYIQIISIAYLSFFLAHHFFSYFMKAFSSTYFFQLINKAQKEWEKKRDDVLFKELKKIELEQPGSKVYEDKRLSVLDALLCINAGVLFVARKFERFLQSRVIVFYYLFSLIWTLVITVACFGFIYLALSHIDPSSFSSAETTKVLHFFYFSFVTLLGGGTTILNPSTQWAFAYQVAEIVSRFALLTILLSVITNIMRERHNEEMRTAIANLEKEAQRLEAEILERYQMSLAEAKTTITKRETSSYKVFIVIFDKFS